jgi:hypothetical protein
MGKVAQTSEDQGAIQQPNVAKTPGFEGGMKKYMTWLIEENIDRIIVFKCSACILKWVAPKHRRICALICWAAQIEVRVLLEGDTGMARVTAKVPKNLWKGRTGT